MNDRFRTSASFFRRLAQSTPAAFLCQIAARTGLRPGARLLEWGCGSGQLAAWMAQRGIAVDAVDLSESMIALARRDFGALSVTFHQADAITFALTKGTSWDVVLSFESMHIWIASPDLPRALSAALARGGHLVVAWRSLEWEEPCREAIVRTLARFGVSLDDWGYWTCPQLPLVLDQTELQWQLGGVIECSVKHSSRLGDAVEFLMGIDRVQDLKRNRLRALRVALNEVLAPLAGDLVFSGEAKYTAKIIVVAPRIAPTIP